MNSNLIILQSRRFNRNQGNFVGRKALLLDRVSSCDWYRSKAQSTYYNSYGVSKHTRVHKYLNVAVKNSTLQRRTTKTPVFLLSFHVIVYFAQQKTLASYLARQLSFTKAKTLSLQRCRSRKLHVMFTLYIDATDTKGVDAFRLL